MALFKALRPLTSTPLDAVEDENCGDVPTKEDEARDYRIYQVEALAAELVEALAAEPNDSAPDALPMHAVKSAWESIGPNRAQRTDYSYLKKVVIKKK